MTTPANIRYLANHIGTAGTLLVTRSRHPSAVDFRYKEAVRIAAGRRRPPARDFTICDVPDSYDEALVSATMALGARVIGIEAGHLTVARHEWLTAHLAVAEGPASRLRSTERFVEQFGLVKDAAEVWPASRSGGSG